MVDETTGVTKRSCSHPVQRRGKVEVWQPTFCSSLSSYSFGKRSGLYLALR